MLRGTARSLYPISWLPLPTWSWQDDIGQKPAPLQGQVATHDADQLLNRTPM